jgi:Holliday junction resolvase RusA-like endonuclease
MPRLVCTLAIAAKPQGSKTPFKTKTGKLVVVESSPKLKEQRARMSKLIAALATVEGWQTPSATTPISVTITCGFEQPASNQLQHHTNVPDLDKLVRFCLDACTDAGVWLDDKQVTKIDARKIYSLEDSTRIEINHE